MTSRYRKGQTFRPPSAAESAASADTVEGFRKRPPSPQDQPPYGQTIVVITPAGGIPARNGTTIYSAACTKCIESSTADEKTLMETDEELLVYNLQTAAVSGDAFVKTALSSSGTRYVEFGGGIHWGKLDANLTYNDNTGVTVSVWTGKPASDAGWDIENVVIAELLMTSGQLDANSFVKIELIDGIWYVTGAPC